MTNETEIDVTDIDQAHAAMTANEEDDIARLRFYERLSETELFMLLEDEAEGDQVTPALFEVEDQSFVLIFDREARMSEFYGKDIAPYAALSGRGMAQMLQGQRIGMALNMGVAPSAMLIPAEAVDWLAQTLGSDAEEVEGQITELTAPKGLPETLLEALDRKLATAAGLAVEAYLCGVTYDGGGRGHMLAFVGTVEGAEAALTAAVNEALVFSGIDAGMLDVAHLEGGDPVSERVAKVGLRFDLPTPQMPSQPGANPGMDPSKPPKLN
ncbi:SseB family protein [Octadecabacter sp. 1_MG-2023]|uniref:SseB family protein n=1 Tax=unclassified Octadecabacter TaxID=196158 RepID=UPI001C080334|nr:MULTISPECIES: SseB family protein [unclassified Octadecabacter]MBU2994432.1 SseB family protein [Octadecabacter sp. B2R22]MDO6734277.1 SseB family protein [Octadecabacter sp. 1_MG-2023]